MAGPVCVVIGPKELTSGDLTRLDSYIHEIAFNLKRGDREWHFWVRSDKLISRGPSDECGLFIVEARFPQEWDDSKELADRLPFKPKQGITLIAMASPLNNHKVLASMAIAVANMFAGLIALDGCLPEGSSSVGIRIAVDYNVDEIRTAQYEVVDTECLRAWLSNPNFRLPK